MCEYKILSPCTECFAGRQVAIPCSEGITTGALCTQMTEYEGDAPDGVGELCELHYYEAYKRMGNAKNMRGAASLLTVVGSVATCVFMYRGANLAAVLAGSAAVMQGISTTVSAMTISKIQRKLG